MRVSIIETNKNEHRSKTVRSRNTPALWILTSEGKLYGQCAESLFHVALLTTIHDPL